MVSSSPFLCSSILVVLIFSNLIHAASFNESCRAGDPPCQALVAYRVPSTSIANISTLFSVSPQDILAANGFSPRADVFDELANETVKIVLPCPCVSNRRAGNLQYTVVAGDWLSTIAGVKYGGLVTYEEITAVSGIPDPNQISAGQNVTIPYPCSCRNDMLSGRNVLFMSYVVREGESAGTFAGQYGISVSQFESLNAGVEVKAGAVIKLPVESCKADFNKDAVDANLTAASGSYVTTANGCVQCSCSDSQRLYCTKAPLAPATCSLQCQNSKLQVGNWSTRSSSQGRCTVESCLYDGYSDNSSQRIFTKINTTLTNRECQSVQAPPTFAYAPEEQGVPEATGPTAQAESPNAPPGGTSAQPPAAPGGRSAQPPGRSAQPSAPGGRSEQPPASASSEPYSFGLQQVFMFFLLLIVNAC